MITPFPFDIFIMIHVLTMARGGPLSILGSKREMILHTVLTMTRGGLLMLGSQGQGHIKALNFVLFLPQNSNFCVACEA